MTREEFEVCRNDPYRAFDAAQQKIRELQQRVTVAKNINRTLLADPKYQFGQAVQNFERLKAEHIQLNDAYNDLEAVNESLQEVTEVLRGDKHQLLIELNAVKREIAIQGIENQQLELKARQLRAFTDTIDLKLRSQEQQLAQLDDDEKEATHQQIDLKNEIIALEATCQNLSLQSSSLSDLRQHLDTTRVAQDRAIQALEREIQSKAQEMVQHDSQLWEFKREMSGRILALQKKAQECHDELFRLHRLSEHEINTLAAQNRALNDELKSTADALYATRKEKTDFSTAAKREIHHRKEEIQQCLSVLDLVERQNQGLESSILRMMEQNKLSERQIVEKDNINNKNLIEQANFISMVHMDLQSTREDLYILKARLCHNCRESILTDEVEEEKMIRASLPAQQAAAGLNASKAQDNSIHPMEFSSNGLPIVSQQEQSAVIGDAEKSRMENELKRTREALEALNRQLLEERANREKERREEEELRRQEEDDRQARMVEEEAKKHRAREDERKLAAGEEAFTYTIRFVDGSRKKVDAFPSDLIRDVIQRVCAKAGVRAVDLFFLAHSVNENSVLGALDRFLDKNRSLEQENITPKSNLVFKFKHYKRHRRWADLMAQDWFFRQIHQNVITEYYPCHERLAVELASYEIQAVFGDYSGKKRHSYFDRVGLDSYLPVSVSAHEYEYWQERLFQLHKKRKGMSATDSRNRYIDTFSQASPFWGMTFFDIRDRENRPFIAGIAEDGMYILSASKKDVLTVLRFTDLLGWERSPTGIFVKRKGTSKMTLYGSSKLQSKEMVDLLNEYYMMLPQDLRDQLGIKIEQSEELRARLPPPELFESPLPNRKKPVEFYSRLEYMKTAYMSHCLELDAHGQRHQPIVKFTTLIDRSLDEGRNLEDLDLSDCDPPLDDTNFGVLHELFNHSIEQFNAVDTEQWKENIVIKRVSLAHDRNKQVLTGACVPNLCNMIRKFPLLTQVNLSYIPLEKGDDIAQALAQLPGLEVLILKGCKIGPRAFSALLLIFQATPSRLHTLDLELNSLAHASISPLCEVMKGENCSLKSLNLAFNRIEASGLEQIVDSLRLKRRLQVLDFGGNPGGKGNANKFADLIAARAGLTEIGLSSSNLSGGEKVIRIAAELKGNGEVRKINLSDNPIGEGLTRLRQAGSGEITRDFPAEFFSFLDVGTYCCVQELVMDNCQIHEDAGQALASVLHNNTKLTTLVMSNNELARKTTFLAPAWHDMLTVNQHLTKLDLSNNGISYLGLMKIFASMMRNRSIVELKLDRNLLDRYPPNTPHIELQTFLENNTTIKELSLCDMQIKDDLLIKIGEGLRRNRSLVRLVANNNEITVRGVQEFSRCLSDNSTLNFLDLSCKSVQISDELYLQAYKALIEASNLETVLI